MAQPEKGLEDWELKRLRKYKVASWTNAEDAKMKLKEAMKARAKANENAQKKSGFGAIDAVAQEVVPAKAAKNYDTSRAIEVLPATQTVDVRAPQMNVHIPAPAVTIHQNEFKFWPVAQSMFSWCQAAAIGAALHAAYMSQLPSVLTVLGMK